MTSLSGSLPLSLCLSLLPLSLSCSLLGWALVFGVCVSSLCLSLWFCLVSLLSLSLSDSETHFLLVQSLSLSVAPPPLFLSLSSLSLSLSLSLHVDMCPTSCASSARHEGHGLVKICPGWQGTNSAFLVFWVGFILLSSSGHTKLGKWMRSEIISVATAEGLVVCRLERRKSTFSCFSSEAWFFCRLHNVIREPDFHKPVS